MSQNVGGALLYDLAFLIAWELREGFKEACHFRLGLEPTNRLALKCITDDAVERRVWDQNLSPTRNGFVTVTDRSTVDPISALHPCPHLLGHLAPVLLALERALGGHDGLDELVLRRLAELEIQAFHPDIAIAERIAQIQKRPCVPACPLQIVEDDDKALAGLGVEP